MRLRRTIAAKNDKTFQLIPHSIRCGRMARMAVGRPCSVLPAHPVRSTRCGGRSPGSLVSARSCLPGLSASGVFRTLLPLTVAGAAMASARRASPCSLFTPDLSIRGTIVGHPIGAAAAWQWPFMLARGGPFSRRRITNARAVAVAVDMAPGGEQFAQRSDDHAACPSQFGNGSDMSRHSSGAKTEQSTRQASNSARIWASFMGSQPMKTSSWRRSPHIGSR